MTNPTPNPPATPDSPDSPPSPCSPDQVLRYKRSRFTARLPLDRLYSPNHYWLKQHSPTTPGEPALWHVGFTRFAQRMLGDIVEFDFETPLNAPVQPGQIIGWVEAFKAVSDVFCVATGTFLGPNPALKTNPELIDSDTQGEGWLYAIQGQPDPACISAHEYAKLLDGHIDQLIGDEEDIMADDDKKNSEKDA